MSMPILQETYKCNEDYQNTEGHIGMELEETKNKYCGEVQCLDGKVYGDSEEKQKEGKGFDVIKKSDAGDIINDVDVDVLFQDVIALDDEVQTSSDKKQTFWVNCKSLLNFLFCCGYGEKRVYVTVVQPPPLKLCGHIRKPLCQYCRKPLRSFKFVL